MLCLRINFDQCIGYFIEAINGHELTASFKIRILEILLILVGAWRNISDQKYSKALHERLS